MTASRRALRLGVCCVAALSWSVGADAQNLSRKTCAEAASRGQVLRDEGKLIEARARFVTCAQPGCPPLIQKDCAEWQTNVDARLPGVVVAVKDVGGRDIGTATVQMDKRPFPQSADGRAVPVDPGKHLFRAVAEGFVATEVEAVIREGERARAVQIVLPRIGGEPATKPVLVEPPPEVPASGVGPLPWVFAGLGIAGLGAGTLLYLSAKSDFDALAGPGGCKPRCTDGDVSPVETKATLSYVAFGIGGAAAITSIILFATSGGTRVRAGASGSGAAASFEGHF
ncbi:MAG: hypothetical protein IPG50_26195 [Myxococcales bacterium]|nr:hypothetical protein [Myxococcales bacterium]